MMKRMRREQDYSRCLEKKGAVMQLKDILDICRANEVEHFEYTVVNGDINTTVTGIASDSR